MLDIRLDTDLSTQLDRFFLLTERNIRFATGKAMTATVRHAQAALKEDLRRTSGGPIQGGATPWTIGGTYIRFARPDDLTAEVGLRTDQPRAAGRYISVLTKGGKPRTKAVDLKASSLTDGRRYTLVPSPAQPLDSRGNISRSNLRKALENLNTSALNQSRPKQGNSPFFALPLRTGDRIGIFQRTGRGRRTTTLRLILDPTPKPRASTYDLRGDLNRSVQRVWPGEIRKALEAELRRAGFG
jgi:hypothetical protein